MLKKNKKNTNTKQTKKHLLPLINNFYTNPIHH